MSICAIIPAAGNGSRLGLVDCPKTFAGVNDSITVFDVIRRQTKPAVDHTVVILAPSAAKYEAGIVEGDSSCSVRYQNVPTGTADAIFAARDLWKHYDQALIVWGDQVGVRCSSLLRLREAYRCSSRPTIMVPLAEIWNPYTRYDLTRQPPEIHQAGRGERHSFGYADTGVFLASTVLLRDLWWRGVISADWLDFLRAAVALDPSYVSFLTAKEHAGIDDTWFINVSEELEKARLVEREVPGHWMKLR